MSQVKDVQININELLKSGNFDHLATEAVGEVADLRYQREQSRANVVRLVKAAFVAGADFGRKGNTTILYQSAEIKIKLKTDGEIKEFERESLKAGECVEAAQ